METCCRQKRLPTAKITTGKGYQRQKVAFCCWKPFPMAIFCDVNLLPSENFSDGKGCRQKRLPWEKVVLF